MAAAQTMKKHHSSKTLGNYNDYSDPSPGVYAPDANSATAIVGSVSAATTTPAVTTAGGGMNLIGVNISGGEYGPTGGGTIGYDYTYPSASEISCPVSGSSTAPG